MPFDIVGARNAGYSDAEIADELAKDNKFNAGAARKAGYNDQEILGHLLGESGAGTESSHWYDPSVNFAKDVARTAADAPLVPIKIGRGLNKAIGSAINWATEPSEDSTPEQIANAQSLRDNLTPGTSIYDDAEAFWKPKIAAVQESLATPEATDLLSNVNKIAATGVGSAIKLAPALPFGVGGMATISGMENYDEKGDAGKALIQAAQSAVSMKAMGVTHWMAPVKAVAAVSGISGADAFVSNLAETGDVEQAMKAGGIAAAQMAFMDITNRGMMPAGANSAISRDLYKRMTSNGTPHEIAADLASRFNPNIKPSDTFYRGNEIVAVDKAKDDYAETLGDYDAMLKKGYSMADLARMGGVGSPFYEETNRRTGAGSAAKPADMSTDQHDMTTGETVSNPTEAPASAINVNSEVKPQGNILDEMLNGSPAVTPVQEVAPQPVAEVKPADVPSVQPVAEPSQSAAPANPLTPAAVDQEVSHLTAVAGAQKAELIKLQTMVANGGVDPKMAQPLIALAKARIKAAEDAAKGHEEVRQANLPAVTTDGVATQTEGGDTNGKVPEVRQDEVRLQTGKEEGLLEVPALPAVEGSGLQGAQDGSVNVPPPDVTSPADKSVENVTETANNETSISGGGTRDELTKSRIEGAYGQDNGRGIKAASAVLEGIHGTEPRAGEVVSSGDSHSREVAKRPREADSLIQWAKSDGKAASEVNFSDDYEKQFKESGTALSGGEHDVVLKGDVVHKLNRIPEDYHLNYKELLDRVAIFNDFFPTASMKLIGVTTDSGKDPKIIFEQKKIAGRNATVAEVDDFLINTAKLEPVVIRGKTVAYRVPNTSIIFTDVYSGNSKMVNGGVVPIDYIAFHGQRADDYLAKLEKGGLEKAEKEADKWDSKNNVSGGKAIEGASDGEVDNLNWDSIGSDASPKTELTSDEQADAEMEAALERRRVRKAAEAAASAPPPAPATTVKEKQAAARERLKPQSKREPIPNTPRRTAGEAAVSAAGHSKSAFDAGVAAINDIFKNATDPNKLGSGPVIDDKIWAQIKPHLDKMWAESKAAFKDATEALDAFVDKCVDTMGEKIVPYMTKFYREVKSSGTIKEKDVKETSDEATRPAVQSGRNGDSEVTGKGDGIPGGDGRKEQESKPDAVSDQGRSEGAESRQLDVTSDYVHTNSDTLGHGSPKVKAARNIEAVKIVKDMVETGRLATPEERDVLANYVGWGAVSQLFDADRKEWSKEHTALKDLLTPAEWDEARNSTQNAFYTPAEVVNATYAALARFGITGGTFKDSATGVGNWIGMMPAGMKNRAQWFGAEKDIITATIAKSLYPSATIINSPYEDVHYTDNHFDVSVGNPPYGETSITDVKEKDLSGLSLHNYFFAKDIKKLRPGGILAQVVSSALMDKPTELDRLRFAKDVRLVGAIRLPNTTFKDNAGTSVTTDIIFLQKLKPGEVGTTDWTKTQLVTGADGNAYRVNEYFAKHPEMVLGDYAKNGRFGEYVDGVHKGVAGVAPKAGVNLADALKEAIAKLPENIYHAEDRTRDMLDPSKVVTPPGETKVWGYFVKDGVVHQRTPDINGGRDSVPALVGIKTPRQMNEKEVSQVTGMLGVLDAYRRLQRAELSDETTGKIELLRKALNHSYDSFVKEHGYISQSSNERVMRGDINDFPNLLALEKDFDKGVSSGMAKKEGTASRKPSAQKADIFTKRQLVPYTRAEKADTAYDALMIALSETGRIDLGRMEELTDKPYMELLSELGEIVFKDPDSGTVLADEYLSGNVKKKLARAKEMLTHDPKWQTNIDALEKVQPADLTPDRITVKLGAHWVPTKVYGDFISEILEGEAVTAFVPEIGRTVISYPKGKDSLSSVARRSTYGTDSADATWLLERIFDNRDITIRVEDEDGNKSVDADATLAANQKAAEIKNAFDDWLWTDPERRELVAGEYNAKMNTDVERNWDGKHLITPGKSESIKLHKQQMDVAWRAIQDGRVVMDHCVGAGKTFAIITAAMEMRRMGLSKKPMVVVPNHLVGQWAGDFKRLYPAANILMISRKDFTTKNRKAFIARIATGDYDAVVIAHSSFGFIPAPAEYEKTFYGEQLQDLEIAIREARSEAGDNSKEGKSRNPTVKELEAAKDRFLNKLKKLQDKSEDDVADFDQLGVDSLFVDESHEYRTLYYTTRRSRIKGLGNTAGNKKTTDLFVKAQYLMDRNNGRGLFFATGTPISNTMAEVYTIQKYMDYRNLKAMGLHHFDTWANTFGTEVTDWELNAGMQLKATNRFKRFVNAPELAGMYRKFADVVTLKQLKAQAIERGEVWPVPKVKGGKPNNIIAERSEEQADFMNWIVNRMENIDPKRPDLDNHLWCETHARMAGLDLRILVPDAIDHPDSKVNRAVSDIYDIFTKWDAHKGTQLVFCDLSTPKKHKGAALKKQAERDAKLKAAEENDAPVVEDESVNDDEAGDTELISADDLLADQLGGNHDFSVYDDMKAKLIAKGMKESQIAFIHDYNTDAQKMDLYAKMNAGDVRVLFGSTSKMGAGMNVQERLVALHHMDAPYMPKDLEQREGRIIRQGNKFYLENPEGFYVEINRYGTKEMYDARMWEIVESKAGYTEQFRNGGNASREIEDVVPESENAASMKAAISGNPLIREEMDLNQKVKELTALEKNDKSARWDLEAKVIAGNRADANHKTDMAAFDKMAQRKIDHPHTASSNHPEWRISLSDTNGENTAFQAPKPKDVPVVPEREALAEVPEGATKEQKKEIEAANAKIVEAHKVQVNAAKAIEQENEAALDDNRKAATDAVLKSFTRYVNVVERGTATKGQSHFGAYRGFAVYIKHDTKRKLTTLPSGAVRETFSPEISFSLHDPSNDTGALVSSAPYERDDNGKYSFSPTGLFTRLDNMVDFTANPTEKAKIDERRDRMKKNALAAQEQLDKPSPHAAALEEARTAHAAKLAEINATGGDVNAKLEVMQQERWDDILVKQRMKKAMREANKAANVPPVAGAIFHQNPMLDPAAIVKSLSGLKENLQADIPKLIELGKEVYKTSGDKINLFLDGMRKYLGGKYEQFRAQMIQIYRDVKRILADERGKVGKDINAEDDTVKVGVHKSLADAVKEKIKWMVGDVPGRDAVLKLADAWDGMVKGLRPESRSDMAKQMAMAMRAAMGKRNRGQDSLAEQLNKAVAQENMTKVAKVKDWLLSAGRTAADKVFSQMPAEERHAFMQAMDTGDAAYFAKNPHLEPIAIVIDRMFQAKADAIRALGTGALKELRENYFPHIWERTGEAAEIAKLLGKRPAEGSKSFSKHRVFDDVNAGLEAGYKPVSDNPIDLVFLKMAEMDKYLTLHNALQAAERAGGDIVRLFPSSGDPKEKPPTGYDFIKGLGSIERDHMQSPGDDTNVGVGKTNKYRYVATEDVAQILNNYTSQSLYSVKEFGIGHLYGGYMGIANVLNRFQLGVLSAFHAGFTSVEAVISHAALGLKSAGNGEWTEAGKYLAEAPAAWILNPKRGGDILKAWREAGIEGVVPDVVRWLEMAGAKVATDTRFFPNDTQKMMSDWSDGNHMKAVLRSPLAFVEQSARPIMEMLVPRQKVGVFGEMADYWVKHNPEATQVETAAAMQQIWNRVDSRLGQVVYDRLFVNGIAKNVIQGLVRAPGWTGGTILEVGGGIPDLVKAIVEAPIKGKLELSDRAAYTLSLLMVTAISNALLTAAFTGEAPDDWRDLFAFRTGNIDEYGNPERFMLPTYMKDMYAYAKDPITTLTHKAHPLLGLIGDIKANKDYYGVEVRHPSDNAVQQAGQVGKFVAKAFIPFWMRGVQKEHERDGSALAMAAPLIGIMPATKKLNQTEAEAKASELAKGHFQQRSRTQEEADKSQMKSQIGRAMRLHPGELPPEVAESVQAGTLTRRELMSSMKKSNRPPIVNQVNSLTIHEALDVWDEATNAEKDRLKPVMQMKIRRLAQTMARAELDALRPKLIKAGLIPAP